MIKIKRQQTGFTLIEILVALLIFSILALMMTEGLSRMIRFHDATVKRAAQLRELQFAFLLFSRDLEQAVNRPSTNGFGKKEPAFLGSSKELVFTHAGQAGALLNSVDSQLQRVSYTNMGSNFIRSSVAALDYMKNTPSATRVLSHSMTEMRFQYYSRANKRFYDSWPLKDEQKQALPSAIRVYVTIPNLGKMSQLYVIPAGS